VDKLSFAPPWLVAPVVIMTQGQPTLQEEQPGAGARDSRVPGTSVEVDNGANEKNENLSSSDFPALSGMKSA
jgi:hypothetical protein